MGPSINPELVEILKETIGEGWIKDTMNFQGLLKYVDDKKIQTKV